MDKPLQLYSRGDALGESTNDSTKQVLKRTGWWTSKSDYWTLISQIYLMFCYISANLNAGQFC